MRLSGAAWLNALQAACCIPPGPGRAPYDIMPKLLLLPPLVMHCRLPAAYRLALAECARRAAWQEMFAGQAARLAEHCGRITAKEASKREGVRKQLERHLPLELLAQAGLLQEPPHCTVSAALQRQHPRMQPPACAWKGPLTRLSMPAILR